MESRRLDRLHRGHPELNHHGELAGIEAMGVGTRIGTEGYPHPRPESVLEVAPRDRGNGLVLLEHEWQEPDPRVVLAHPIEDVVRRDEVSTLLLHQPDALIVDEGAVLD